MYNIHTYPDIDGERSISWIAVQPIAAVSCLRTYALYGDSPRIRQFLYAHLLVSLLCCVSAAAESITDAHVYRHSYWSCLSASCSSSLKAHVRPNELDSLNYR